MAGGDMRAFYQALGIDLPGWAHTEAPVRCFAAPDAHKREDRDASCSVNLRSGLFNCHGCGACGGPYDAALVRGRSPREAFDLMVAYALAERRPRDTSPRTSRASTREPSRTPVGQQPRQRLETAAPASLAATGDEVHEWAEKLHRSLALIARLESQRGWSRRALVDLEIGFDGERITVPIWRPSTPADRVRAERPVLQGVLRLRVKPTQQPKVIAVPGTRLGLLPPPSWTRERRVLLVEGPSDMLAARSAGVPAIAVPGANAWRSEWATALERRTVVVTMDCDRPGRQAAARIAEDLERRGIAVAISDLAPGRQDGYDVSDWLRDERNHASRLLRPPQVHPASAYRRMIGLPAPSGATTAPRATAQPRRITGGAEGSIGTTQRRAGCRTFF
jgi:5S rRNA maturation endonuclease (ribonuclease M5)